MTKRDLYNSLKKLNIKSPNILLVHSSLKSLGHIEGGAQAVVDALTDALGAEGTLVMPTLCSEDWKNVYKTWHIDKPSEVGIITETFRKNKGVMRSDHATHSVCAHGKFARYITQGHAEFGPRYGIFGNYAFSHSSPWQKMYDLKADVLFIGVTMVANTFKHFIEYRVVEKKLGGVIGTKRYDLLKSQLMHYSKWDKGIHELHDAVKLQKIMESKNMVLQENCGPCKMLLANAKQMVDFAEELFDKQPHNWYSEDVINWLNG